jgi:opacity protein-like surface antigen
MNVAFKKLTVAVALASLVATGSLAAATPAAAGWGWRHGGGWGYHGGGWGVPVAAGLLGGPRGRRDRRRDQSTRLLRRSLLPGEPPCDRRLGQRRRLSTHAGL